MRSAKWLSLMTASVLASCGATTADSTSGAFRTPDQNGRIPNSLIETQSAVIGDTIAIVAGRHPDLGLRAYAGIIPDQPPQPPLVGHARFEGPYTVAFIENIIVENEFVTGRNSLITGTITLETDFAAKTLTGSDEILTVRGQISDTTTLSGEVTVLGVPGQFEGHIGSERAFGAFHGSTPTNLMSGGFVADRVP